MKSTIKMFALGLMVFLSGLTMSHPASAQGREEFNIMECVVKDPTGTSLNVRSTAGGKKVVRTLKNGTTVWILDETVDRRKRRWSSIRLNAEEGDPIGWVLSAYLQCGVEEEEM